MSDSPPPEKKGSKKRAATDPAEDLTESPGPKRATRATGNNRRTSKALEVEEPTSDSTSPSPIPQENAVESMEVDSTPAASSTSEPASSTSETAATPSKKASLSPSAPSTKPSSTETGSQAETKSSASTVRSSQPTPRNTASSAEPGDLEAEIEERYSTMSSRRFIPYRTKKVTPSSTSSSNFNDLDIVDTIRDVADIVEEDAVSEVLEVVFSSSETIATSRPNFIHEVYKIMSI